MPTPPALEILVVEDDGQVASALRHFLLGLGARVTVAATLADARARMASNASFGGVIVDVELPDGSGLDLLSAARERGFRAPALVLTGHRDERVIASAQLHQAQFLPKPPREENLRAFLDSTVAFRDATRARLARAVEECSARFGLTPRESQIVLLASSGVARADLAEKLGIEESTTKTLVRRLLRKSGRFTLGELTATIHRSLFDDE